MDGKETTRLLAGEHRESPWVWAALSTLLVLFLFSALRFGPLSGFGIQDGALYFSSGKALATHEGYILPSLPIRLRARKYPELYPFLLAGVWRLDPHFPSNIYIAVCFTLFCGCLAMLFAFLIIRRWPEMDDWQALAVVTLCAFTSSFLVLSASIMSDIPFTAAMLGAVWLAGCTKGARSGWTARLRWRAGTAFASGLLAGLSVGFRSLGIAAIAGIGLVLLLRRDYLRTLGFSLAAAPIAACSLSPTLTTLVRSSGVKVLVSPSPAGWRQTLCYYSSYACNWRMNTEGSGVLKAIVLTNLKDVVQQPGLCLLTPLISGSTLVNLGLVVVLSAGAYAGIVRYVRRAGWQPLPVIFLFYLLAVLPWPYTPGRFLVPFLPLFFGGLWLEGRHFVAIVKGQGNLRRSLEERAIGRALVLGAVVLMTLVATNYCWAVPKTISAAADRNRRVLADECEAYKWIRKHTAIGSRIIAYRGGLAYLYTGRQAVPAIMSRTQAFYLGKSLYALQDAAHLADVARYIHASYWIASQVDFSLAGQRERTILQKKQNQLLAKAPLVFQSADRAVKVYNVRCLDEPREGGCPRATSE